MERTIVIALTPESSRRFVPVLATPAQIIPTADPRDLRAWEANEIDAPADERFSAEGGR